jgi:Putative phage serine protease XkdF
MNLIELIIDEKDDLSGVDAISVVQNPAIESNFVALKSEEIKLAQVNAEKRILMGAVLIPEKPIYRRNGEDEYYIYFSKDTVNKASQLFFKNGNQNNWTLEHGKEIKGLTVVESWIVEDTQKDKSAIYNLSVPVGTWMASVKVEDDNIWNDFVKTGKVKGFSLEGYFADKLEEKKQLSKKQNDDDVLIEKIKQLLR